MAPEMISERADDLVIYDQKVDIWATGIVIFELLTHAIPHHTRSIMSRPSSKVTSPRNLDDKLPYGF